MIVIYVFAKIFTLGKGLVYLGQGYDKAYYSSKRFLYNESETCETIQDE